MDTQQNKSILVADREQGTLDTLTQILSRLHYKVYTAQSAKAALDIIDTQPIGLVMSGTRLADMEGYAFLKRLKTQQPAVVRIILSTSSDEKIIMRALNENVAKANLPITWEAAQVGEFIHEIFQADGLLSDAKLLRHINSLDHLPNMMKNCQAILDIIDAGGGSDEIVEIISNDQSLTTEILRLVNSAFYGRKTSSVKSAIVYLGMHNVRNLVLSDIAYASVHTRQSMNWATESCWRLAVITRKLMEHMYSRIVEEKPDLSILCSGLLCNIGRSLIAAFYGANTPKYAQLLKNGTLEEILDYEQSCLGFTHDRFGACLLNWWGLPYVTVESALYHYDPLNPGIINKKAVAAIALCAATADAWVYQRADELELDDRLFTVADIQEGKFYACMEDARRVISASGT